MDDAAVGAIIAVPLDASSVQRWFDVLNNVYDQNSDDWDAFQRQFADDAASESFNGDQISDFVRYLDDHGRLDTIRQLREAGAQLPQYYEQLMAQKAAAEAAAMQGADPVGAVAPQDDPWQTVIARFGPGWAGWDGTEQEWARFRDWTYTNANNENPQLYAAAYEKLNPLNTTDPATRITQLTQLGFTINATPPTADTAAEAATTPERSDIPEIAEIEEKVVEPVLDDLEASMSDIAEELGMTQEELEAEIAKLPEDFIADVIVDELSEQA